MPETGPLNELFAQGARLWVEGGRLHYRLPRGAMSKELRRRLADCKEAILARVSEGRIFPLSLLQNRIWFLSRLFPQSPMYNVPQAIRIEGGLREGILCRCLDEIVRRHQILRTVFPTVDGHPVQLVPAWRPLRVALLDLSALPAARRSEQAMSAAAEESRRCFDLSCDPPFRVCLMRLSREEHLLTMVMHHIAFDAWSLSILLREIEALYAEFSGCRAPTLCELPLQYGEFALRQRRERPDDGRLSYWKRRLAGSDPSLGLPFDRPAEAVPDFRGRQLFSRLGITLTEALNQLSRSQGTTLFMTLFAAFQALLHRCTGRADLNVGTTIAGRPHAEAERLIGFFVNTLVIRSDASRDPRFCEFLGRTRDMVLGAFTHQDVPFEALVQALQPERDISHTPLFQVDFQLLKTSGWALRLPKLRTASVKLHTDTAKFALSLTMLEQPQGLTARFEHSDRFETATVQRMARCYRRLLEGIVADPGQRLTELPILSRAECQQLLLEWNDAGGPMKKACLHEFFEYWAARTPDSVAAAFGDRIVSYGELNRRSIQRARHLASLGIGLEARVAICLPRSLGMIASLLGILKAGACYVPLEPSMPPRRLAFLLQDSGAAAVIGDLSDAGLPGEFSGKSVCFDALSSEITSAGRPSSLDARAQPESLAYVIYTSGSTGLPKGVAVSHGEAFAHCTGMSQRLCMTRNDRLPQFSSLSIDVSVEQVFLAHAGGACLVIRGEELWSPEDFPDVCSQLGITAGNLPTAYWLQIARSLAPGSDAFERSSLRLLSIGGQEMPLEALRLWRGLGRSRPRLFNVYGPTEAVVSALTCLTEHLDVNSIRRVPIGRPLPGRTAWILDRQARLLPIGIPGEICLGGDLLARGYLNRPALTAQKFIPDIFSRSCGARLYRTGDLGILRPDGQAVFLGRWDHQVKIRGFRVELGEIEAVLSRHPSVQEVAVTARRESQGQVHLEAHVVCSGAPAPSAFELQAFLRQHISSHMVPTAFAFLQALPVTAGGKVDRRALPPATSLRPRDEACVQPRSEAERIIAAIWQELLPVREVGIHDNFFDLGGHSLLMTEVHSKLRKAFPPGLALVDMFRHPTVGALALRLSRMKGQAVRDSVGPIAERVERHRKAKQQRRRIKPTRSSD